MLETAPPQMETPAPIHKVLHLLGVLQSSPTGSLIYQRLQQILQDYATERQQIEQAYAQILHQLINVYADRLKNNSAAYTQIKLLQLRLMPPMGNADLADLNTLIQQIRYQEGAIMALSSAEIESAFSALLSPNEIKTAAPVAKQSADKIERESETARQEPETSPQAEMNVNAAFRQHLHQRQTELHGLQTSFTKQVEDAFRQNNELADTLRDQLHAIQQASDVEELESYRKTIETQLEDFLSHQQSLSNNFGGIRQTMQGMDDDNRKLQEELDKVRLLSLTDELTGLPNRRAFLRRLEEEIGRSQRYGSHLALAIIDLDRFKAVNDTYGHTVGDMVLKAYTREVLAIFRHHDLVARYGGEEFAVILPNTTEQGGILALRKVQRRASQIMCKINSTRFPLPNFSAGLTEYRAGEKIADFVARADNAMYQAKRQGGNAIETTGMEAQVHIGNE